MFTLTTFGVIGLLAAGFFIALTLGALITKELGFAAFTAVIAFIIMSLCL